MTEHRMPAKSATGPPDYVARQGHPRLCTAHRSDGQPCGRYAIRGGNVCGVHGGHAPQVRRKAKQRLDFAKDMMLLRAFKGIPEPERPKPPRRATRPAGPPHPRPEPTAPQPEPPVKTADPQHSYPGDGEVAHITRAQHEALKRGEPLPAQDAPVAQPERRARVRTFADPPPWAEPPPARPTRQLVTEEEALADVARANRRVGVNQRRRKRR